MLLIVAPTSGKGPNTWKFQDWPWSQQHELRIIVYVSYNWMTFNWVACTHLFSLYFCKYQPCIHSHCHNLSLGLTTKARVCKGAGQEWSPGVTFHALGSAGECEGTLLEILGFATVICNLNSVACDTCNCKFVQLPKTSCTWHAVACDNTHATCIYGGSIHVHTYIPIQYSCTLCATFFATTCN